MNQETDKDESEEIDETEEIEQRNNGYNIDDYSNDELYGLLDVNPSISDRELEMKIIENINKYQQDEEIHDFFNKVYDHFFQNGDHDNDYNEDDNLPKNEILENMENMNTLETKSGQTRNGQTRSGQTNNRDSEKQVILTNPLPYSKDNLNPLLNQTIRRIVSIDSQYRSIQYPFSTSFSFDLSDPLRDVLSLKLYSVQIPYTWYTINKDFGSNFLFLKGTSAGINNGNYDYIIDISAGNYSASNLVNTVNASIAKNKTAFTDISFGITDISYNPFTSTATLTVEITKIFNETNYYVSFPSFINPILNPAPAQRSFTLPSYLGFDVSSIPVNVIYSNKNIIPFRSITANGDLNNSIYTISTTDTSNNYIEIIQYEPAIKYDSNNYAFTTSETDASSNIIQTIVLKLSLSSGTYSRDQIQSDLSTQLQNSEFLSNSKIERVDRTDASFSYFSLSLSLNQKTTANGVNAKIAVKFPDETSQLFPIWTGTNSCFYFDPSFVEVSDLLGETPLLTSSFFITNNPIIHLECIEQGYENPLNDLFIVVDTAPNPNVGYTLTEYVNAINRAFTTTNTANNNKLSNSGFTLVNSTPTITFDINNSFTTADYGIDFTDSVLNLFYGMQYNVGNISGDLPNPVTGFTFTGSLTVSSSYSIPVDAELNTIPAALITIYPQDNKGNSLADPFIIPFIYTLTSETTINDGFLIYTNNTDLGTDINKSISLFVDQNGENAVSGTNITYGTIINNGFIVNITINVLKNITQNGYNANLYDLVNGVPDYSATNSWKEYFSFVNDTYPLIDYDVIDQPFSQFTGTLSVVGESITLFDNSNNFFFIKPQNSANGLFTATDANDIRIDIPAGTYTTTIQLFDAINNVLTNNALTVGSNITSTTINSAEYTKFRINVNKVFTASDFSIVFYDIASFVRCYVGDSSVRNTTWDTTLGWILGFQEQQVYALANYVDPLTKIATITGDTSVNTNLYNYLLLSLDDFNQNRLNDGVVTITKNQISVPLPSYGSLSNFTCDVSGNKVATGSTNVATNNLTLNQVYSLNQVLNAQQNQPKPYTTGPFVKDVFAFIPLRVAGLQNGQSFVETSGQLQQQDRLYFGPVNIHRMQITLYNDKGTVLDLNGTNFSFSFICEQLYQKQKI